jgi:hypothetical protein
MGQFINKEQPPYQLKRYLVGPSSSMESLDNWKGRYPGEFTSTTDDAFLLMVNYLNYFDIGALEQVCKPFFVIIRLKGPKI